MFFLGKAFQMRGKAHGEEEKPFLDHLEELRVTITKIVLTLLITTVLCWVFKDKILDIVNRPVEQVWNSSQSSLLPQEFSVDKWEEIKRAEHAAKLLPEKERPNYYRNFSDSNMQLYAEAFTYYNAAMQIHDETAQKKWLASLTHLPQNKLELVNKLYETQPNIKLNARNNMVEMKSLKPTETFMLSFKLAFYAGLMISSPLVLWFILEFILPGLHAKEKKVMWPAMVLGLGLFAIGSCFAYFIVLPQAIGFFFEFGKSMGVEDQWRIGEYVGFVTNFTLIFGLAFELPVVVIALVKIGMISYTIMAKTRAYAFLVIFIIAAAITPGSELLSLCLLVIPMYLLYEMSILYAYFHQKKEERQEQERLKKYGTREIPEVSSSAMLLSTTNDQDETELTTDEESNSTQFLEEKYPEEIEADDEHLNPDGETEEDPSKLEGVDTEGQEGDSDSYEENLLAQEKFKENQKKKEDS